MYYYLEFYGNEADINSLKNRLLKECNMQVHEIKVKSENDKYLIKITVDDNTQNINAVTALAPITMRINKTYHIHAYRITLVKPEYCLRFYKNIGIKKKLYLEEQQENLAILELSKSKYSDVTDDTSDTLSDFEEVTTYEERVKP